MPGGPGPKASEQPRTVACLTTYGRRMAAVAAGMEAPACTPPCGHTGGRLAAGASSEGLGDIVHSLFVHYDHDEAAPEPSDTSADSAEGVTEGSE